jgi:hypothetical protein
MSAIAKSNGFASRDAVAGSGLQLVTETKFMQQYRTASAAHGGGSVIAVKNAAGQIEIFTTGTDGSVWNFYPDPASSTGFRSIRTGLTVSTGKPIAAGLNAMGFLVVFAVKGLTLNYAIESPQAGPARWGSVQEARLTPPSDATTIDRVLCYNIGRALYVGVLFQTVYGNARYWPLYCAIWGAVPTTCLCRSSAGIGHRRAHNPAAAGSLQPRYHGHLSADRQHQGMLY